MYNFLCFSSVLHRNQEKKFFCPRTFVHYDKKESATGMKQQTALRPASPEQSDKQEQQSLGPFLCWAVVFADIGTSIYYVPGILYGTVGKLAGFFVLLTMIVFILLTFKYVEVTYRFPQGGGVVTVFAGSFLAFSGLESISQLSPAMKLPRRVVGKIALFLVILTVGLTSPLLTILSTLLLPKAAADPVLSSQIISLLAGRWGGQFCRRRSR